MISLIKKFALLILLSSCAILISCEDPFGFTKKKIKYNYYIENFQASHDDPGLFYLKKRTNGEYTDIFEGIVEEIAWDNNNIYAKIHKCYRGDTDGIYVLDMEKNIIYGPLEKVPKDVMLVAVYDFYKTL